MMSLCAYRRLVVALVLVESFALGSDAWSQPAPVAESNLVKLLKKAPDSRLGTIIEMVGKRGDVADLTYLLERATAAEPAGFASANRRLAFEVLADAASTRNVRPAAGFDDLNPWIASGAGVDPSVRLAAIRLGGVYRSSSAIPSLVEVAGGKGGDRASRDQALDALATIGTDPARAALEQFVAPTESANIRLVAVAALSRVNIDAAANHAADVIASSTANQDLAPLIAPFLDRQGGAEKLLGAIDRHPPGTDAAKLALRAISSLGRSDEALVASLSKRAGIEGDPKPPGPVEMATLIAAVASQGDPVRGERIFRRAEINCMKCHAIAGAAGGVGPELSSLGLSSPVDYIVNSILIPDQAIKEEYQTRVVLTTDGRVLQGIVVEEDDRRLVLKDAQAERLVIPTSAIEETKKGGSLMPKGLVATLTRPEFIDLVRFLSELGRPGAYVIRSTPTIQRWRCLHPTPSAVAEATSSATFPSAILTADPAHWLPLYSWTSGNLPVPEILEATGGQLGIVQGEIVVSAPGALMLRFGAKARPEIQAWIDDQAVVIGADGSAAVLVDPGTKRLTVRVDGRSAPGAIEPIHVEVVRINGSTAEYSVVGGR